MGSGCDGEAVGCRRLKEGHWDLGLGNCGLMGTGVAAEWGLSPWWTPGTLETGLQQLGCCRWEQAPELRPRRFSEAALLSGCPY